MTTGANLRQYTPILATLPTCRSAGTPADPYAFLTARDLRGLVAAMVD
jgi:hypothetical protein